MRHSMIGLLVIGYGPARLPEEIVLPESRTLLALLASRAVRAGGFDGDRCLVDPDLTLGVWVWLAPGEAAHAYWVSASRLSRGHIEVARLLAWVLPLAATAAARRLFARLAEDWPRWPIGPPLRARSRPE